MHTATSIVMRAQPCDIYEVAASVERWPDLLPHYRYVRVAAQESKGCRLVEMAAQRDGIPVHWWAEQTLYPDEPRITFRHVRGVTSGMDVEWSFRPTTDGTVVLLSHDFHPNWPFGALIADRLIGPFFVENIAGKTLHRIKELVERS